MAKQCGYTAGGFRLILLVAMVATLLGSSSGHGAAATVLRGSFRGEAYGTYANATAGTLATTLGRSAYIACGCKGTSGVTRSNTVNNVDAGKPFRAEKIYSTAYTNKTATTATVKDTAKVTGVRALDGLITADAIYAVANTNVTATTISSNSTGSTFSNLRVLGQSVSASVAPNTRRDIPGFGYVILKEVTLTSDRQGINVNMLHLYITRTNTLKLPVGSQVLVAHATSGYNRNQPAALYGGQAYALTAISSAAAVENTTGRAAAIYLGCLGTGGVTRTNNVNVTTAPGIASSGTGVTNAYGGQTSTGPVARTTAKVQSLNLLSGRITADVVTGVARSTYGSGGGAYSTAGSGFVGLKILGVPVSASVSPNTRVMLPGMGYAILYQTSGGKTTTSARIAVYMVHVYITMANDLGLPVGTEVIVASASSSVRKY
ncbi:MAG: hypothetical protein H0V86_11260 [Chloroflexia bacterium]|nr:hypothetical protein [Chloroflexia bacterium]